jgi:alkylated DNA repair dioxygenase AlkB
MKPNGLELKENFISEQEEENLISYLDSNQWNGKGIEPNGELKRRTLQFGALFRYKTRKVESEISPLPVEFDYLLQRLNSVGLYQSERCNHLVVNEYQKGQGIMPHIDSKSLFGNTICSLSLLSDCTMEFENSTTKETFSILLPRQSLLILQNDIRYNYKHSISKNLVDKYNGVEIERSRRVSLTFRTIISTLDS